MGASHSAVKDEAVMGKKLSATHQPVPVSATHQSLSADSPSIFVSGHPDSSYNGAYHMVSIVNAKPAYKNSAGCVLYHFFQPSLPGERSWSFDDRNLDGSKDWFHGGWAVPLPGGNLPLGRRVWSLSSTFGEESVTLTLTPDLVGWASIVTVSGHLNDLWNGDYVEQAGVCFGEPVYVKADGMVLYRYATTGDGAGTASMSLDDRQQNGCNDWFRGGWFKLPIGENSQKMFGTHPWSLSAREGETTTMLTLTFKAGSGRPLADIIARMLCDLPHAGTRKPYGDTHYYELCRTPAAGTIDEIADALPSSVAHKWLHPRPPHRLRDGATGDSDPVENRAAWFWTSPYCYQEVNRGVIEDDLRRLQQYAPLVRSINCYIRAHSPRSSCAVWRGSKMNMGTYNAFQVGCNYRFCMYAAYSEDRTVAEAFHCSAMIKLNVPERCQTAAWFEPVTFYKGEKELLLAPYTVGGCVRKWKEDVGTHKDVPFIEFNVVQDSDEFQIRPGGDGIATHGSLHEGVEFKQPYSGDFCR